MEKVEMAVREAIVFCVENGIESAVEQLISFDMAKPNRLSTKNQINALKKNLECFYETVEITGGGKRGKVILSDIKDKPTERKYNYKGTVATDNQQLMAEIIFNKLLKLKDHLYKYETGLSYSSWANLFGIYSNPKEDSFKEKLVEIIEELHNFPDMKSFKPIEVVEKYLKAIDRARKGATRNAFNLLQRGGKIKTTTYNIKAVPSDKSEVVVNDEYEDQEVGLKYVAISDEEYEAMKKAREDVLTSLNVSITEYNDNIGKKNRTSNMNRAFRAVKKRLKDEFDAVFMFESIKVEIIDVEQQPNDLLEDINGCFFAHFQKLTRDRQNRGDYNTSTYFWKRFYLLNTFAILEYLGYTSGIDYEMYNQAKSNYQEDMLTFQYDFVGYEAEREIFNGVGVFGDFKAIVKKKQEEWLEDWLSTDFKEDMKIEEVTVSNETIYQTNQAELKQQEINESFNVEPLSEIARYVNSELEDFFIMDKNLNDKTQIEPVVGATNSEFKNNENLSTVSISQLEVLSTHRAKINPYNLNQREIDELHACLEEIELAFTKMEIAV